MKFIHFGCWNKGKCDKKTNGNPLSQVMNKLETHVKGMNPETDFIIVAGDNYYSDKAKQPKEVKEAKALTDDEQQKLKSGFSCLGVTIPVYVIYGNHDVINKKDKHCSILTTQQKIEKQQKAKLPRLMLFTDVITITEHQAYDTAIIMFDSSLYTLPEKDKGGNVSLETFVINSCYKHLFPKFRKFLVNSGKDVSSATLADLRDYQTEKITEAFETNTKTKTTKNIIFVAHHPLVNTKPPKLSKSVEEPNEQKNNYIVNLIALFKDTIGPKYIELESKPTIYYLCADYHVYQHMDINITLDGGNNLPITQYTVGTGGATLDEIDSSLTLNKETDLNINPLILKYTVIAQEKTHGFLEVEVHEPVKGTSSPIVFNFISISPPSESHRKYLKYKMKYLNLKLRLYNTS